MVGIWLAKYSYCYLAEHFGLVFLGTTFLEKKRSVFKCSRLLHDHEGSFHVVVLTIRPKKCFNVCNALDCVWLIELIVFCGIAAVSFNDFFTTCRQAVLRMSEHLLIRVATPLFKGISFYFYGGFNAFH